MNIHISIRGEEKGPYALSQIEAMWNNGTITADALYWNEGRKAWRPVSELLSAGKTSAPHKSTSVFAWLVLLAAAVGCVVYFQNRNKETPEIKVTEQSLDKAVTAGVEKGKQILAFRQQAQDTLTSQFSKALADNMQGFLDAGVAKSFEALGGDHSGGSGLTPTGSKVDSLTIVWPDKSAPQSVHDAIDEISTYTAVYTIFWKSTYGTGTGYYQFEQTIDINTQKTISLREVKMNASPN